MKLPLVMNRAYRVAAQHIPEKFKPGMRGLYNDINKIITYGTMDIFTALDVEINAKCNVKCTYCPSSTQSRGKKFMPTQLWQKILNDLSEIRYSGRISPHFYGEPMLDERLAEFVKYARASNPHSQIVIHTNGTLLNRENYRILVESGVTGFLITKHLPNWPKPLLDLIKTEADASKYIRCRTLEGITLFNRGGTVSPVLTRRMKRCHYLSDEIAVTYTGEVVCTNDFHVEESFGNVNYKSLLGIWHSEKFRNIRKRLRSGHFDLEVCRRCALSQI